MGTSLLQNPVVQKSLRRLKRMGLKVYVEERGDDAIVMVVDNRSVISTIIRMVSSAMTYPKHFVWHDEYENAIVIACWRGEEPEWVRRVRAQTQR